MTQRPDSHEYFRLLAAASIDGEVTPGEALELRAHLATCASCRADERAMRSDNAWLASVEALRPPRPEVRRVVLWAADGHAGRGLGWGLGHVAATFATIVVAAGAAWWLGLGRLQLPPGAASPGTSVTGSVVPSSRPSAFEPTAPVLACAGNPFAPSADISTTNAGFGPWAIAAADLNGDSLLDLVILNKDPGSLGILVGDGRGGFSQVRPVTPVDPNPLAGAGEPTLTAADVTNDGQADMIAANPEQGIVVIFVGDGTGGFGEQARVDIGGEPSQVAVRQFGGDSSLDLAVADRTGAVRILIGAGDGSFTTRPPIDVGGTPRGIAAADLNGDGRADLVVGHDDKPPQVLLGAAEATFAEPFVLDALPATDVNLVDIDADGDLDVLFSNSGPNSVSVLLGDGAGSFGAPLVLPLPGGAAGSTEAIDLDADGNLDIVANNGVSDDLAIFFGDGHSAFQLLQRLAVPDGPTGLVSGDFDRDGRPDVATSNTNASSVSVFLNRCRDTPG